MEITSTNFSLLGQSCHFFLEIHYREDGHDLRLRFTAGCCKRLDPPELVSPRNSGDFTRTLQWPYHTEIFAKAADQIRKNKNPYWNQLSIAHRKKKQTKKPSMLMICAVLAMVSWSISCLQGRMIRGTNCAMGS